MDAGMVILLLAIVLTSVALGRGISRILGLR